MPRFLPRFLAAALLAGAALLAPTAARAQEREANPFEWNGNVAAGSWLRLQNVNGSVRIEGTSGSEVEVRATKRWRRGNPEDVRIVVTRYGSGGQNVLVCAIWNDARCDENGYRSNNDDDRRRRRNDNDVSVEFVVRVPRGVNVAPGTVNGPVRVSNVTGEVRASTVNGDVEAVSLGGPVTATTVNGDVDVRMTRLGDRDLTFTTVNGSVTVGLPAQLDADVELTTVNGRLEADYPLTISGRVNPRHLRATIGRGGPRLQFTTVNGSVTLKKSE
jgi:hypothetical protein